MTTATHDVFNQPPPRTGHDAYEEDVALREGVARHGASWADERLHEIGRVVGDADWIERGRAANEHRPELLTHDRFGHRIDEVRYHPAYHELVETGVRLGLAGTPWREEEPGAHVARAAGYVLWPQIDSGTLCPMTMTYAVVPSLRHQPDVAERWEPKVTAGVYDPRFQPVDGKDGALFGMAMTEKQGGSDVRANTTRAEPLEGAGPGATYALTGHKWFTSAPMNDAFLVLAKIGDADTPSCFLVPRWLDDGSRNVFRLQRLKDKLGDRSNASSEVEFDGTVGWLIGEEHRGVRVIMEMVAATRLDCVAGAAGWMRHGTTQAAWHVAHREAFGKRLADQPLMRNVIADLAIETEAAIALTLRLAATVDDADDPQEQALRRLLTPIAKYWVCKRAPGHAAEALECLGGNGYVEESGMPRLFRQSPLNGIWEGSGNVQCLDVLRAMGREPASVEALVDEVGAAAGADRRLDDAIEQVRKDLAEPTETGARMLVERLALVASAALLVRDGDPAVADAFVASRLVPDGGGLAYGTLPDGLDLAPILTRALPALA